MSLLPTSCEIKNREKRNLELWVATILSENGKKENHYKPIKRQLQTTTLSFLRMRGTSRLIKKIMGSHDRPIPVQRRVNGYVKIWQKYLFLKDKLLAAKSVTIVFNVKFFIRLTI